MKNYIIFCLTLVFFSCEKEKVQPLQSNQSGYQNISLTAAFFVSDSSQYSISIINGSGNTYNFNNWLLVKSNDTVTISGSADIPGDGSSLIMTSNAGFSGGIKDETVKLFDPNWTLVDTWNKSE